MAPPAEISIPTTSKVAASGGDKPYTLYNITLRLPLRSFVVQKRYSEFAALHATLTALVGEAPPEPLPAKAWFRSTVASTELTETRRVGLEAYLRAIAESPDRRWRDTSAWRAFLNLPSTSSSSAASGRSGHVLSSRAAAGGSGGGGSGGGSTTVESRLPAIGLAAANAAAASDPGTWIDLHKEMKRALHDARMQLARRDAAISASGGGFGAGGGVPGSGGTSTAVEAGAAAKRELVKAGSLLSALTSGLKTLQDTKRIGDGELRRRHDLLAAARVERDGLETLSTNLTSARNAYNSAGGGASSSNLSGGRVARPGDKANLFGGAADASSSRRSLGSGRILGGPAPETERTRELENDGVLQLQKQMMGQQDQEVAALAKIVERQRQLGLAIKQEVDSQTDMLERMSEDVDRVQGKVKVAKDRVRRIG